MLDQSDIHPSTEVQDNWFQPLKSQIGSQKTLQTVWKSQKQWNKAPDTTGSYQWAPKVSCNSVGESVHQHNLRRLEGEKQTSSGGMGKSGCRNVSCDRCSPMKEHLMPQNPLEMNFLQNVAPCASGDRNRFLRKHSILALSLLFVQLCWFQNRFRENC